MTWNEFRATDRCRLERVGWRTSLTFRENLVRDAAGLLGDARVEWCAEAERIETDAMVTIISAVAPTRSSAWRKLRITAAIVDEPGRTTRRQSTRQHTLREMIAS